MDAIAVRELRWITTILAAVAMTSGCGSAKVAARPGVASSPTSAVLSPGIYRAEVTSAPDGEPQTDTEWVLPEAGAWRTVDPDGRDLTSDGQGRFRIHDPDSGTATIRQGSDRFLGPRAFESVALPVLSAYQAANGAKSFHAELGPPWEALAVDVQVLSSSPDDLRFSVAATGNGNALGTIDAMPDDSMDPGSFNIPITADAKVAEEVDPGSRANPPLVRVTPYWLGPTAVDMKAVGGLENRWKLTASEQADGIPPWAEVPDLYQVNYEPTSGQATLAWDAVNADVLDVISTPIDSAYAKAVLAIYDGADGSEPWPRRDVTLRDGSKATVIAIASAGLGAGKYDAFAIETASTLVHITGQTWDLDEVVKVVESNLVPVGR